MGLDKGKKGCKTGDVKKKLSLAEMGYLAVGGVRGYINSLFGRNKQRVSPLVRERESFERGVKDQFLKLKEKGLGISIFTL